MMSLFIRNICQEVLHLRIFATKFSDFTMTDIIYYVCDAIFVFFLLVDIYEKSSCKNVDIVVYTGVGLVGRRSNSVQLCRIPV